MGVEELVDSGDGVPFARDITIQQLVDKYGEEKVKRGLNYMLSLDRADQKFRGSAEEDNMKEGFMSQSEDEEVSEEVSEASKRWSEAIEENGLGLSDE